MKKILSIIGGILIVGSACFALDTHAVTCNNTFPVALNNYTTGQCIPSAWGNALEAAIGVTSSTVTSSLEYQVANVSTSSVLTAVTYFSKATAILYVDSNRTDTYVENGSSIFPFKTISAAIASSTGYAAYAYILSPGTYVDGAPDTWPSKPFIIQGNESTYVPASGATFPGSFDIYDLTIAGNVVESDNSLTFIHQFNNGVITGNLTTAGLATLVGSVLSGTTSTLIVQTSSILNFAGGEIFGNIISQGFLNINDADLNGSSSLPLVNSTAGSINLFGVTIIQSGNGGGIVLTNGATSTPNNIVGVSIVENSSTAGSTLNAGTAATILCTVTGFTNFLGSFIAPTGSNFQPCLDESHSILGGLTLPSLTPNSLVETNGSDTLISANGAGSFGSSGQVQYASTTSGLFAATSTFKVNSSTGQINFPGNMITGGGAPTVNGNGSGVSTTIFSFVTSTIQTWTVPSNVTSVTLTAIGGSSNTGATAGLGAISTGTLTVTPGTTYYICVGQQGVPGAASSFCGGGGVVDGNSYAGGGMTWFSTTSTFSSSSVILVAGGGGGDGFGGSAKGGNGGFPTGVAGQAGNGGAAGGGGGTQTGGGAGGATAGVTGTSGQGGTGGINSISGGGGGGGYWGGGGGGGSSLSQGGAGGGGSSFFGAALTATSSGNASTSGGNGTFNLTFNNAIPLIAGTDNAGLITANVSTTIFTITFSNPFINKPAFAVTPNQSGQTAPAYITATTSSIVITFPVAFQAGQTFNYVGLGY